MNIGSFDPCTSNKTTWYYVSLLLAGTTCWMKQRVGWNKPWKHFNPPLKKYAKGGYNCSSEMQCLVSVFRLEFKFKKKEKKRKKDEFHPKENPYTQSAQPPIFSYRNINSVRHQYNGWEAITFIIFESILWNESLNTDGQ